VTIDGPPLHIARFSELDAATLYELLRLRVDVFVVEQECPYPELDGRDAEPGTRHLWFDNSFPATPPDSAHPATPPDSAHPATPPNSAHPATPPNSGASPAAYLRILTAEDGTARIGRVAVAHAARGTGLAGQLMLAALDEIGDRPCVLDAQAYLVGFYRRYGFTPTGPEYDLDGIAHIPMMRVA
jgi:ElaA protein